MADARSILMTTDTVGGVFTYALTLADELSARGHVVHLATMGPAANDAQRARARSVHGLVLHESLHPLEWMDEPWAGVTAAGEWLVDLARQIRPCVVHLNGYAHGALDLGAPKIVVAHSCVLSWWEAVERCAAPARYDTYRAKIRAGLEGADRVVAVSEAMRAALVRNLGITHAISVVHNGARGPAAVEGTKEREPFVLSCGRVWDRAKNVAALARVAPRLSWPVRIAGWEAEAPGVESLGWLAEDALGAVMQRASIFALPVRYEPFGLSALEAALRGAALVLGDVPSQREIWDDAAVFVDPDDDDALAAVLLRLIASPAERHALAGRARQRASRYSARRLADAMLAVYDTVAPVAAARRPVEGMRDACV